MVCSFQIPCFMQYTKKAVIIIFSSIGMFPLCLMYCVLYKSTVRYRIIS